MKVRDAMTPGAEVVHPDLTARDCARRMRDENVGSFPVGEGDRLIGMVTDRDVVVRAVAEDRRPSETRVRDVMSVHVHYCFEDDDVEDAAEVMARHQVRRVPVLDREKRLVGIVALADLGVEAPEAGRRALQGVSRRSTEQPRR